MRFYVLFVLAVGLLPPAAVLTAADPSSEGAAVLAGATPAADQPAAPPRIIPPPSRPELTDAFFHALRAEPVEDIPSLIRATAGGDPAIEAAIIRRSAVFLREMREFVRLRQLVPAFEARLDDLSRTESLPSAAAFQVLEESGRYFERIRRDDGRAAELYRRSGDLGLEGENRLLSRAHRLEARRSARGSAAPTESKGN